MDYTSFDGLISKDGRDIQSTQYTRSKHFELQLNAIENEDLMKTSHFNLFKNSEPIVEGYRIDAKSKQALWDLILIVFL